MDLHHLRDFQIQLFPWAMAAASSGEPTPITDGTIPPQVRYGSQL
jgi:hypothetical protein